MRHLVSPGTISPSCAGNCQDIEKLFNLCVGNAYPRNDQSCFAKFSVEPVWVLTGMVIAAGSHCWERGGNFHWNTDISCPGKSSDAAALGTAILGMFSSLGHLIQ